jgi:hypothetical protein
MNKYFHIAIYLLECVISAKVFDVMALCIYKKTRVVIDNFIELWIELN